MDQEWKVFRNGLRVPKMSTQEPSVEILLDSCGATLMLLEKLLPNCVPGDVVSIKYVVK